MEYKKALLKRVYLGSHPNRGRGQKNLRKKKGKREKFFFFFWYMAAKEPPEKGPLFLSLSRNAGCIVLEAYEIFKALLRERKLWGKIGRVTV